MRLCAVCLQCALCKLSAVAMLELAFSQEGLCRLSAPRLRCVSSARVILRQLYARYPQFARRTQSALVQLPARAGLKWPCSQK